MNPPKGAIKKWIEALRSGKYKQDKYQLQTSKGFCCLGVACDLFSPKHKRNKGILVGFIPDSLAPHWLVNIAKDPHLFLSWKNDVGGFSFDEIADCLQAVYVLKVLE